jgi:thiamine kinase-like enzyme
MKHILKKGKISLLLPDIVEHGGGLSGEVHLVVYDSKKYVVRRCSNLSTAKRYEDISKKLGKYWFLPKFLGRYGKDVLYEYIEGRDLTKIESLKSLKQMGIIAGYINRIKVKNKVDSRFNKQLKQLASGGYVLTRKEKRKLKRVKNKRFKVIFKKEKIREIRRVYNLLKKKVKPTIAMDINDVSPTNFRIDKKGRVYLVDIEGIKPRIKGFGFAKFYLKFGKTFKRKKAYEKGYNSVTSIKYLTKEYLDFIYINFFIQKILYNVKIFDRDYKTSLKQLNTILREYKDIK